MSRINIVLQSASLLLEYPDERLLDRLNLIEAALTEVGATSRFGPLLQHLRGKSLMDLQAFHSQEFDLSRRHVLHLTYWTSGDTRRRGEELARIKQVYRESGFQVSLNGELPDYLPLMLEYAAVADLKRGCQLLHAHRASLELLRLALKRDQLPHECAVEAVCVELGGPSPQTVEQVKSLVAGPPSETVGMRTVMLPYPSFRRQAGDTHRTEV